MSMLAANSNEFTDSSSMNSDADSKSPGVQKTCKTSMIWLVTTSDSLVKMLKSCVKRNVSESDMRI